MEAVTYKLEQFEGPLDLLLSLIQKNKVSITDIPLVPPNSKPCGNIKSTVPSA